MNMKNTLINSKFLLLTIICSVICIIWIKHLSSLNTMDYNDSKKIKLETILPEYHYTLSPSSNLTASTSLAANGTGVTTLSRGYVDDIKSDSTKDDNSSTLNENKTNQTNINNKKETSDNSKSNKPNELQVINAHLPNYLMYKNVQLPALKDFLKSRNSLLAEEPYFSTIISVSKEFNLNPLVMFAITGQEQSFVPKSNKNAYKIANNPFNVFNSWKKYNTNIEDTTSIAARTIVNLSKNKPDNVDAFTWVNRKYSQDQNWSKAVRSIFKQLESNVSYLN